MVLDVNIVVSGLMFPSSPSGVLLEHWLDDEFDVLTCFEHIDELRRVTRYPKIRARVRPHLLGKAINRLRNTVIYYAHIAAVELCRDPFDNYLLGLALTGKADFLISGDKADLLSLEKFGATRIVSPRQSLRAFESLRGNSAGNGMRPNGTRTIP
ncbi:MAG: putative toxin-antitoxin system toxin component, PIN family [Candidatus Andeanibacterium colombiense]|uniref:Toxin-antitoxin system toxin component, PIN family n=1 Tax=Candidatus Andeanibacterium colombiense TaxID=3121345 RepID=A0AAJ5XBX0_9SPHN|nr:MAG: putative toxin-antitoxin system toxin component, PIN family [Sphingomonadaceae bacterium]